MKYHIYIYIHDKYENYLNGVTSRNSRLRSDDTRRIFIMSFRTQSAMQSGSFTLDLNSFRGSIRVRFYPSSSTLLFSLSLCLNSITTIPPRVESFITYPKLPWRVSFLLAISPSYITSVNRSNNFRKGK